MVRPVRERALLVAAVVALLGGLGMWALVSGREHPDDALARFRPTSPPIGSPVVGDAPSASDARQVLAHAKLGGIPLTRMVQRSGTPIHGITVPGRDAIAVWERLVAQAPARGLWPVLLGDAWSVRQHAEAVATTIDPPAAIVRRARALDVEAWLRERGERAAAREGTWPEDAAPNDVERYAIVRDARDLPLPEVAIAFVPSRDSIEAPAWLAFGNWHECPEPTVHVAMLARWRERWGAEPVAIGPDSIELRVSRPPSDREAAMAVAREHVAYAPSLVRGGSRSIADLAAERLGARSWTFRWPRAGAGR
jgi:hypothetical protein